MQTVKVLIVEDEVLVAMDLEATLEDLGFVSVGIAADSAAALELVAARPDVALVDVNLRDGPTGPAVGQKLANEYSIPVVFMTANPRMLAHIGPGPVGVVQKPFDSQAMAAVIAFALNPNTAPPAGISLF